MVLSIRRGAPVLAVFLAGMAAGLFVARPPDRTVWAGPAPVAGDVNGDSMLDLSDPVYLLAHLFRGGPPPVPQEPSTGPVSTIIVVRHAERESTGDDPALTPEGQVRAEHLAEVLAPTDVDLLVSSTLRRTRETLQPLADLKGLPVQEIMDAADVVARLETLPLGSVAVVAHHSFTIHDILDGLGIGGSRGIVNVSGDNYDNFLVVLRPTQGDPQLVHLKY